MVLRVLQFLIGAALAGGGGYLAWTHRADAGSMFPPGAAGLPVLLLAGLLGVTAGIVFLVSAVHPRPNQRRMKAEKAAREDSALNQADAYYSERARAVDRDWRSAGITPPAQPIPVPPPAPPQPAPAAPAPVDLEAAEPARPRPPQSLSTPPAPASPPAPPLVVPAAAAPVAPPAQPVAPQPVAPKPAASVVPAPMPRPAPPPPVAASPQPAAPRPAAPAPVAAQTVAAPALAAPAVFPANATLSPLPRAETPPPVSTPPAKPASAQPAVVADDPHASIRAAIIAGKLDEADKMLVAARDNATGAELAQLTALAGDHAAVSGRQSHAKWLWRLALKRFGELDAMNTPAAKAVAESLRQAT